MWASGDGGEADDCNCDGYAASMWTISINSAINDGQNAHYDESCSSTLASTFSNGAKDPNTGVVSIKNYNFTLHIKDVGINISNNEIFNDCFLLPINDKNIIYNYY